MAHPCPCGSDTAPHTAVESPPSQTLLPPHAPSTCIPHEERCSQSLAPSYPQLVIGRIPLRPADRPGRPDRIVPQPRGDAGVYSSYALLAKDQRKDQQQGNAKTRLVLGARRGTLPRSLPGSTSQPARSASPEPLPAPASARHPRIFPSGYSTKSCASVQMKAAGNR